MWLSAVFNISSLHSLPVEGRETPQIRFSFLRLFLRDIILLLSPLSYYYFNFYWSTFDLQRVLVSSVLQSEPAIHISTVLVSIPILAITKYWVEFPVLVSSFLLVL